MKKNKKTSLRSIWREGDIKTRLSFFLFGLSDMTRGRAVKGLGYLALELLFILFMGLKGNSNIVHFITLGTNQQGMVYNEKTGIYDMTKGDNSMLMLLGGVVTLFVIAAFALIWISNLYSAIEVQRLQQKKAHVPGIIEDIQSLFDSKIHKLLLALPLAGIIIFTVVPLAYMILMAFTNYDMNHQPPGNLFDWVGFRTFVKLFASNNDISYTFWHVLGWTLIWAVFSTVTCYFGGMLLAILINRKGIRGKGFWRTMFVITIAVPSFVTLMIVRVMLAKSGAINVLLQDLGFITSPLPFLTDGTWAKVTIIIVNMWIGIPVTMLITTGILTNIPSDLYESAEIDGANKVQTFFKITLPYMLFVTTPYLVTNFISNINNFNAIYLLNDGNPATLDYFKGAGKTDILVTWLYKLTMENRDYCYASAIGIVIFVMSAVLSLVVYRNTGAYKNEEGFQ